MSATQVQQKPSTTSNKHEGNIAANNNRMYRTKEKRDGENYRIYQITDRSLKGHDSSREIQEKVVGFIALGSRNGSPFP